MGRISLGCLFWVVACVGVSSCVRTGFLAEDDHQLLGDGDPAGGDGGDGGGGGEDIVVITVTPLSGSELANNGTITLEYSAPMVPSSLLLAGTLAPYADYSWSSSITTLTLTPASSWPVGAAQTLVVDVDPAGSGAAPRQTLTYAVVPLVVAKPAALVVSGVSTVERGECSGAITLEARDGAGASFSVQEDTPIIWTGTGAAILYSDAACSQALPDPLLPNGSSSAVVYLKDSTQEELALVASSPDISSAPLGVSVLPNECDTSGGDVPFAGGVGTLGDPYIVCTGVQLDRLRLHMSSSFVLGDDIDLSGFTGNSFAPIGTLSTPFSGRLDGQGHTISGLSYSGDGSPGSEAGLFGSLSGRVSNLSVVGFQVGNAEYAGGIVGIADGGQITDVTLNGDVSAMPSASAGLVAGASSGDLLTLTRVSASGSVVSALGDTGRLGGMVGYEFPGDPVVVVDSSSDALVADGSWCGGITAYGDTRVSGTTFSGTIDNCDFAGGIVANGQVVYIEDSEVTGTLTNSYNIGGIVGGWGLGGVVLRSRFTGTMHNGGGIVQMLTAGRLVAECEFDGVILDYTSAADDLSGGIAQVGTPGLMVASVARGEVAGGDTVGGLVGRAAAGTVIVDSYSAATVNAASAPVGGAVGRLEASTLERVYAASQITGPSAGGLVGETPPGQSTISSAYWDSSSATSSAGGSSVSPANMLSAASFPGFDFAATWTMPADVGQPAAPPRLRWEVAPSACTSGGATAFVRVVEHDGHITAGGTWQAAGSGGVLFGGADGAVTHQVYEKLTFVSGSIPANAEILEARLFLETAGTVTGWIPSTHALEVRAERSASPSNVTGAADGLSRPRTAAVARWPSSGGLVWNDAWNTTANLAPVLQEVVDDFGGVGAVQLWITSAQTDSATVGIADSSAATDLPALAVYYRVCP